MATQITSASVSNDYPPALAGVRPVQGCQMRTSCCLHFSGRSIGENDAYMVQYGELATSHVEVIPARQVQRVPSAMGARFFH
jgi:hypothetical protein